MITEITGFLFVEAYNPQERHCVYGVVEKILKGYCFGYLEVSSVSYNNEKKAIRIGFEGSGNAYHLMAPMWCRVCQPYPTAFGFQFFVN